MNSWNLEELKKLILDLYGEAQLDLVTPSIDSLAHRQNFAVYHYNEYIALYEQLSQKTLSDQLEDLDMSEVKIAANILACLQNLHAIHDILGQVIYCALNLQVKKENFYLSDIVQAVKTQEFYTKLHGFLSTLVEDEGYKYLNNLMNRSKHTAVVLPYYRKSFVESLSSGIIFPRFQHKKSLSHFEEDAKDFLNKLYGRESKLLVEIGQEVNEILKNKIVK